MTYQIIDKDHDSTQLPVPPAQIWVIVALEISVIQDGVAHLLLTYPSYPLDANEAILHDEGYWATPFIAYPVPMTFSPPTTVGSLRKLARPRVDESTMLGDLSHLAYQMGLQDTAFEYRGEFIELKQSPRSPGLVKAFRIVRYGLSEVARSSLRNLADPDVRRGYVYLPLDALDEMVSRRYSGPHQREECWFLGKPLISDLDYILADSSARARIVAEAIQVDSEKFSRHEEGILCAVDLAGYGTALKYARERMHSFDESPGFIQESFRKSVAAYFDQMLARLGVMQVQTAGDGFVAAFPMRVFEDIGNALNLFFEEWEGVISRLRKLNEAILDPLYRVGSRVALHYGAYEHGRIHGARSFAPAFDGAAIIEVARLEQGLALAMREGAVALEGSEPLGTRDHCVLLSSTLLQEVGSNWQIAAPSLEESGTLKLVAKEFADIAHLWRARER